MCLQVPLCRKAELTLSHQFPPPFPISSSVLCWGEERVRFAIAIGGFTVEGCEGWCLRCAVMRQAVYLHTFENHAEIMFTEVIPIRTTREVQFRILCGTTFHCYLMDFEPFFLCLWLKRWFVAEWGRLCWGFWSGNYEIRRKKFEMRYLFANCNRREDFGGVSFKVTMINGAFWSIKKVGICEWSYFVHVVSGNSLDNLWGFVHSGIRISHLTRRGRHCNLALIGLLISTIRIGRKWQFRVNWNVIIGGNRLLSGLSISQR